MTGAGNPKPVTRHTGIGYLRNLWHKLDCKNHNVGNPTVWKEIAGIIL